MLTKPERRTKRKIISKKVIFASCTLIATIVGIQPAFAGATADLLYSILGIIISVIAKAIVGCMEIIINLLMLAMATNINDLANWGLLTGFDIFSAIIQALAIAIASLTMLWQLTTILLEPFTGVKQSKSIETIFARTLISIPLACFIQPVAFTAFSEMQKIYTALLDGYTSASATGFVVQLSNQINMDTFLQDLMTTGVSGTTPIGTAIAVFDALGAVLQAMISTIIATGFMVLILWNFLKLIFEVVQRFVIMIVYVYLSPLAAACGVVGEGEITKKALSLFISSGILWILNVWCIGVACSLVQGFGIGLSHGISGVFSWGFVTYGFLKVAQQLDDVFNAVGATNVKLNGSLLDEILSLGRMNISPASAMAGVAGAYQKFMDRAAGKSASNPISPSSAGAKAVSGIASISNGSIPSIRGNGPKAPAPSPSPKTPTLTGPGGAAKELPKQGNSTASAIIRKGTTDKQVKGLDAALNMTPNQEEKADKLKDMYQKDTGVFNKPEVKDWMGKNQLGLKKDEQALVDTKFDPETCDMSGIVVTDKGNGKIALDRVTDLENTRAGKGNERTANAQRSSLSAERAKAGEVQRAGDFAGNKPNGTNAATFSYTDNNGLQHTAHLKRINSPDAANGEFKMKTDSGAAIVSAPKNMSATDVAGVINGSASSDVKDTYSQFQSKVGEGSKEASTSASVAAASAGINSSVGGSVAAAIFGNEPVGNSGRDFATFSYTDKAGVQHTAQMEKLDTPSGDHSEFKMVLDDGREPVINAPRDASAHDVASMVNGTASASVQDSFSNYSADGPSILNAQAATNVDAGKGGSVMSGTAFENSPNTVATVSSASGDSNVSFERIERGTAADGDVWSATKEGVEIGRMTVDRDTGAAEVMSRVMNDSGDDFATIRNKAGFDTDNPSVSFSHSTKPTGPEPMHYDIEPNASGSRSNGSIWRSFGEVDFETGNSGHEQVSLNYNAQGENGLYTPTSAKIADTGVEVFSETGIPNKNGIIDTVPTGKVYNVSGEMVESGTKKIVVDNKADIEDIVSAVLVGGEVSANIKGVDSIREALGITDTMNTGSENALKKFFNAARNKIGTNTKDNPVDAE